MAPRIPQIVTSDDFPSDAEVVVVGGGIMGATLALELAERGIPVVVCEKGMIGGEQSSRNMGWVRKMGRESVEIPLAIEALRLWEGLNERLQADTGYVRSGVAYLFETAEQLEKNSGWLKHARTYGLDTRAITGDEVARILPSSTHKWAGALYTASDGRAEPAKATAAIARAAIAKGARFIPYCAVRTVETAAGRVSGVVTEHGPISCRNVVVAGGSWSGMFCHNLGIQFPQLKITSTILRTGPVPGGPELTCSGPGFVMRRHEDGSQVIGLHPGEIYDIVPDSFRYLWTFRRTAYAHMGRVKLRLGSRFWKELSQPRRWNGDDHTPFEVERTINPKPDVKAVSKLKSTMGNYFPALRDMRVVESWIGVIDVTPDALPVISPVQQMPGLMILSGFSGTGFALGPAAGKLAADLLDGSTPLVDPKPFHIDRLTSAEAGKRALSIGGTP